MEQKPRRILLILAVFLFYRGTAQQTIDAWHQPVQKGISNLKIGDTVPDFKIANIFNNDKKSASISDYSDRLLIFDFGNTACPGCIAALPHMDSLQKEFGDKISIFWVTYEPEKTVQKFWNRSELTKGNAIPTIVDDSTVKAYFKHEVWPHEAWIYKGKVIALTGPDYVDEHNIREVLSGTAVNWPVKNDFYVFDGSKTPLFTPDTNRVNPFPGMEYIALSGYREGISSTGFTGGSGIVRDSTKRTVRAFFLNQPVYSSYLLNFLQLGMDSLVKPSFSMDPNQVVWEVADRSGYTYDSKAVSGYEQDWIRKHGICFESVHPDTGQTDKDVYKSVIADMNHLLGLNVRWERRREKVLVLVRATDEDRLKSKVHIIQTDAHGEDPRETVKGSSYRFRDWSLSNLSYRLNQQESNPYVFDETHYKGHVDMDLDIPSWTDIPAIRKALRAYGLDLKEEERPVDKFVFGK